MNTAEALRLCRLVKAVCPAQAMDEFTPDGWALTLGRYSYDDAKAAVVVLASMPLEPGRSRYIEPGHIIGGINRLRTQRLTETQLPNPPAGLDAAGYVGWLRAQRAAIAAGQQPTAAQLPPADPRRMAQLMIEATPDPDRAQAHIATIRQAIRNNRQEQE